MNEKRRYTRIHFKTPLYYKIRGEAKGTYTSTEDLSPGGVRFNHNYFIPPKTPLVLEFNIAQKALSCVGRVAWNNNVAHTLTYCCGVEFIEIDQASTHCLKDFCTLKVS